MEHGGDDEYPGNAVVVQTADIKTTKGTTYKADGIPLPSTAERCLVADDFKQEEFVSPYTGQVLPYNIYLPEDYNPEEQYPLVLFIHDAGVSSGPIKHTLYQGNGATSWAEPKAQARHKCIVVAPEYPFITIDDNWNYSHHLDATIALLKDLQTRYSIDPARIYTMGQSMGCMSSIVMMLKEPELFAGALLVAGKWNPTLMGPLAGQNIWIISCEGDASSNTLQGEAVALWRSQRNAVTEATWNMTLPAMQLSEEADKMRADGNHLLFTHLTGGNHRATWFVAYGIKGVQDWLFCFAVGMLTEAYRQRLAREKVEYERNKAELALYKAQIKPHFLFNTLNTIYRLLIMHSDKTEAALERFINLTKYMYNNANMEFISLAEEVEYIGQYIDLQRLSLNEYADVSFSHRVENEAMPIPPMLLITFVENAFKYGISSNEPCFIHIRLNQQAHHFDFEVTNSVFKRITGTSQQMGIENCRRRLSLLYPNHYQLDCGLCKEGVFHVRLELNTPQI